MHSHDPFLLCNRNELSLKGIKWEWSINHPSAYPVESAARSPAASSSPSDSSSAGFGIARYQPLHRFSPPQSARDDDNGGADERGAFGSPQAPYSYIRYHFGVNSHFNEDLRINHVYSSPSSSSSAPRANPLSSYY